MNQSELDCRWLNPGANNFMLLLKTSIGNSLKTFFILSPNFSGKILRGEDAPLAAELENWLKDNPGK